MPKIVIVGNSQAAVSAIESIRSKDKTSEIVLVATEGVLPFDRNLLPQYAVKKIKEVALGAKPMEFFEQNKVQVILNEQIARISVKRRQITTESKNHIAYEKLLLLDLGAAKLPAIKGNHKKGIYDCYHFPTVKEMAKQLTFVDNIVATITTFQGLNMVCVLAALKKELVAISPGAGVLSNIFDEETSALLKQILEGKGVRVISENSIEEVLGDTDAKAIKLKTGKVMAADMVIFDDVQPEVKLLAETGLTEGNFIPVDGYFKTSLDEVYAADVLASGYGLSIEEYTAQGNAVGLNLLQAKSQEYKAPLSSYNFGADVLDGFAAGSFRLSEEGREFLKFDGPQNIYKKIYAAGPHLKGTVLFNAPSQKEKILDALLKGQDITGAEEALLD